MTENAAKDFEKDWMTPWETWALKHLFENGWVDMSKVPEAHRGEEDVDKPAVETALIQPAEDDKDTVPEPIPEADWPAWQILSPEFLEYVCTDKAFIEARRRNRVRIFCARFTDRIDLGGLHLPGELWLDNCRLDVEPDLHDVEIAGLLSLSASHFPQGLFAQGLKTRGPVFLRRRASFEGEVSLAGADIGGQLDCAVSSFKAGDGQHALNAQEMKTGGFVSLRGGASFEGEVRLFGADIGGELDCRGSSFKADSGQRALFAQGLRTEGDVFLRGGASFQGTVRLAGADIGAGLQLWGSHFDREINLTSATITSDLMLDEDKLKDKAGQKRSGPDWGHGASLNLQNANIGALQGSLDAWKRQDGKFVPRNLDGLTFTRLAGGAGGTSLDQASTKQLRRWLSENVIHAREDDKTAFTPSPYLAMASALTATGEDIKARNILIALEKRRTRAMRFRSWNGIQKLFRILWLGPVTGYGYASGRGALILAGMIILFAVLGLNAQLHEVASLNSADITWAEHWRAWLGFSFEMALPLADLDPVNDTFLEDRFTKDGEYTSLPGRLRALFMTERFFGLAILATFVAGLTGWAERRGEN